MSLSSLNLDAFLAVAQKEGFSAAAKHLNITQSALSQRVKNLEEDLGLTLFIRTPAGASLTEQGKRLLRYCQARNSLEEELIQDLNLSQTAGLAGTIRLAGYSSVLRSVLIPALKPLLSHHPNILCEFTCENMNVLPEMLQRAEVDFIVMDYRLEKSNLESLVLGQEKYVQITPAKDSDRSDIFLDNDSSDHTTEFVLKAQGSKLPKYRRSYFDDCYGIIDGVAHGLGSAVMPEHLVLGNDKIKILKTTKPYKVDVVLHFFQQPFYSKLQQAVIETLTKGARNYL